MRAFGRQHKKSIANAAWPEVRFIGYGYRQTAVKELGSGRLPLHATGFIGEFPVRSRYVDVVVRYRSHEWGHDIEPDLNHFRG
jgi:hypothetical protein